MIEDIVILIMLVVATTFISAVGYITTMAMTRRPYPKTIEDEWGVDCRDCRYAVKCGAAELQAHRKARLHANRYAGHRVRVTQTITKAEHHIAANTDPLDTSLPF